MGCCSGRPRSINTDPPASEHRSVRNTEPKLYKVPDRPASTSAHGLSELEQLTQAREQCDIERLVKMIPSATKITIENVVLHPWADNPQTIGALAISQLGIYTSRKESKAPKLTEEVLRLNALESLVACLTSNDRDKREASVLALAFLSEDSPKVANKLIDLQALPQLVALLNDEKEGMKSTALLCCRNLYLSRPEIQRKFVESQGCQALCDLLTSKDNLTVFETVLNALDLMLDENDQVQEWVRNALLEAKIMVRIDEILSHAGKYEQDTVTEVVRLKQVLLPA